MCADTVVTRRIGLMDEDSDDPFGEPYEGDVDSIGEDDEYMVYSGKPDD